MGGGDGVDIDDAWLAYGSLFMIVYVLVAAIVLALGRRVRRSVWFAWVPGRWGHKRPEEIAYLNGGPDLAVYSALVAMYVDGSLRASGPGSSGSVRAAAAIPSSADRLQRAIHAEAAVPVPRRVLAARPAVVAELERLRERLEWSGLLMTASQRQTYRWPTTQMAALLTIGQVGMLAGMTLGQPVRPLLIAVAGAGVATLWLFRPLRAPRRTAAGDRELGFQRVVNPALAPAMRPDWGAVGPEKAALSVGIFGVGALMASDPVFADGIDAARNAELGNRPPSSDSAVSLEWGSYGGRGRGGPPGADGGGGCGGGGG